MRGAPWACCIVVSVWGCDGVVTDYTPIDTLPPSEDAGALTDANVSYDASSSPDGSCDAEPCNVDLTTDPDNCGTIAVACGAGETCMGGVCHCGATVGASVGSGEACSAPTTCCSGACVDTTMDPNHCGMCGNSCTAALPTGAASASCSAGQCAVTMCTAGVLDCDGSYSTGCETTQNACGGCAALAAAPASACGALSCGVQACSGTDAVVCNDPLPSGNGCGGCTPLAAQPGTTCGSGCGTYQCSGTNAIVCSDPGRNACGGCTPLAGQPGTACGGGGVYQCSGSEAVTCPACLDIGTVAIASGADAGETNRPNVGVQWWYTNPGTKRIDEWLLTSNGTWHLEGSRDLAFNSAGTARFALFRPGVSGERMLGNGASATRFYFTYTPVSGCFGQ